MIEIYSKDDCVYCQQAKKLLTDNGILFTEHKLGFNFTREMLKEKFPEARTFPVIVVDGFNIGGYNQLKEHLDKQVDVRQMLNE